MAKSHGRDQGSFSWMVPLGDAKWAETAVADDTPSGGILKVLFLLICNMEYVSLDRGVGS